MAERQQMSSSGVALREAEGLEAWIDGEDFVARGEQVLRNVLNELSLQFPFKLCLLRFRLDPGAPLELERAPGAGEFPVQDVSIACEAFRAEFAETIETREALMSQARDGRLANELRRRLAAPSFVRLLEPIASRVQAVVFSSAPRPLDDKLVVAVLAIPDAVQSVQPGVVVRGGCPACASDRLTLLSAVIQVFLDGLDNELGRGDYGVYSPTAITVRDTLRHAGAEFVRALAESRSPHASPSLGGGGFQLDLFHAFNVLSSLEHERATASGEIIFVDDAAESIEVLVPLRNGVDLFAYSAARKLLQTCTKSLSLLLRGRVIIGLGRQRVAVGDLERPAMLRLRFQGRHRWELYSDDVCLMRTDYGEPRLPRPAFDERQLRTALKLLDADLDPRRATNIVALVVAAATELHRGTILLVSTNAAQEGPRLASPGLALQPFPLTPETLLGVAAIDGAVVLDTAGVCHAMGAILDGEATESNDLARGARYNSAMRYVQEHADCVAIVVSDDGMVDVLPKPAGDAIR